MCTSYKFVKSGFFRCSEFRLFGTICWYKCDMDDWGYEPLTFGIKTIVVNSLTNEYPIISSLTTSNLVQAFN